MARSRSLLWSHGRALYSARSQRPSKGSGAVETRGDDVAAPRAGPGGRVCDACGTHRRAPFAQGVIKGCPTRSMGVAEKAKTDRAPPPAAPPAPEGSNFVLWAYTATTFLSALLLFSVQPMFAKMVLPVLGGSPSVWAVAICFFQAALLAGYCYAHLLIAKAPPALTGPDPSGRLPAGVPGAADRPAGGLGRAAARRALSVAARPVRRGHRPAVSRRLGQRAAAAGLVCPHRASARP